MAIQVKIPGGPLIDVKPWKFPCGEVGVKIEELSSKVLLGESVLITCNWEGNDDLVALAQVVDIVKNAGADSWRLSLPYFPYSRQDRRCSPGEAHSLKVFCMFLNSLNFRMVRTLDAHSSVLEALVDNLWAVPQEECACGLPEFQYLVAPDAGAEKKIFKHYRVEEGRCSTLCASKVRGPDGSIRSVTVYGGEALAGKTVCVVDDLCDGGATFIELGKKLREYNPSALSLYVTNGMFTKGVDALLALYDNIYTHNLCNKDEAVASRVHII